MASILNSIDVDCGHVVLNIDRRGFKPIDCMVSVKLHEIWKMFIEVAAEHFLTHLNYLWLIHDY